MTESGIWHADGTVEYEFLSRESASDFEFGFFLHILVGNGKTVRTKMGDGEYVFAAKRLKGHSRRVQ
jgi:hypothetical protein